jgi:hypothetical protein
MFGCDYGNTSTAENPMAICIGETGFLDHGISKIARHFFNDKRMII